jgi:hypothetical protein
LSIYGIVIVGGEIQTLIEGFSKTVPSPGGFGTAIVYLMTGSEPHHVKNFIEKYIHIPTNASPPTIPPTTSRNLWDYEFFYRETDEVRALTTLHGSYQG